MVHRPPLRHYEYECTSFSLPPVSEYYYYHNRATSPGYPATWSLQHTLCSEKLRPNSTWRCMCYSTSAFQIPNMRPEHGHLTLHLPSCKLSIRINTTDCQHVWQGEFVRPCNYEIIICSCWLFAKVLELRKFSHKCVGQWCLVSQTLFSGSYRRVSDSPSSTLSATSFFTGYGSPSASSDSLPFTWRMNKC